jgi:hypothetical protein
VERVKQAIHANLDPTADALAAERHRLANQQRMADGQPPLPLPARFSRPTDDLLWTPRGAGRTEQSALSMSKLEYTKWLDSMVITKFPKGSLVTLRGEAFVPGNPPRIWYEVMCHQEIHYMAMIDQETREPKCVGIRAHTMSIPCWYPPAKLRALQPEEVEAIDRLRTQEASTSLVQAEAGGEAHATSADVSGRGTVEEERPQEGDI